MKDIKRIWWILINANRFRVKYPDGGISVRMPYNTAKDYRDIFGGQLLVDYNIKLKP